MIILDFTASMCVASLLIFGFICLAYLLAELIASRWVGAENE